MNEKVCVDGKLTHSAVVSIDDRGFTLGDGLFETIPLYGGKPFSLDRHLERLTAGAERIGLDIPVTLDKLSQSISGLVENNDVDRGVARLSLTRGTGPRGYGSSGCVNPRWILTVRPYEAVGDETWERGWKLAPVSISKNPGSPLNSLKTLSSLKQVLIRDEAAKAGADEAIAFTVDGYISSCAAANIFWVREGVLETPDLSCAILPGVTRRIVLELAEKEGMTIAEGRFTPDVLESADEVFVTNSLIEVFPVTGIAEVFAAEGPGPVTRKLKALYGELINR